jgi:5'-nucleotidase
MRIVLTNDDGYQAVGLKALYQAASALVDIEISVIASEQAFSGKGHVVSPTVHVRREDHQDFGSIIIVDGAPAARWHRGWLALKPPCHNRFRRG